MNEEIWRPVVGYEGRYECSNKGRVRSLDKGNRNKGGNSTFKGRVLKNMLSPKGYNLVCLSKGSRRNPYRVHRLVAIAFIPNPNNFDQVNHIDGDKDNNSVENLEWCDSTHNNREAIRIGLKRKGNDHPEAKRLCKKDILTGMVLEVFGSLTEASKSTGICLSGISNCANKKIKSSGGFLWEYLMPYKPTVYPKNWGREEWVVNNEKYCGKILFFKKGKKCSWHYHKIKHETFYLAKGELIIRHGYDEDIQKCAVDILKVGETFEIPIGLIHQMEAIEDSELVEFSTQHLESDSYRIIKGD